MWILSFLILSFPLLALEPFEKLTNVQILRVFPGNSVEINRGVEDGIRRNDHAKLSGENSGFSARAICQEAKPETSVWKLYRIPEKEGISKDFRYLLIGMADKEIPKDVASVKDDQRIFPQEKMPEGEIKSDLPEKFPSITP